MNLTMRASRKLWVAAVALVLSAVETSAQEVVGEFEGGHTVPPGIAQKAFDWLTAKP
jgi:hypothetical protein